jgi:Raf kinase inhibitor-like YbhB/YbcL family protein
MRVNRLIFGFVLVLIVIAGVDCRSAAKQAASEGEQSMTIELTSSAFGQGATIPRKYTCDGDNLSPPLAWSAPPGGTQSLALVVDDPDAPRGTYVHWVLFNLSLDQDGLSEGVQNVGVQGRNNAGGIKYAGPCPPPGPAHRYFFKLYALDIELDLKPGANKAEVVQAMEGHILAQGELMGRYGR